MRLMGTLLMMAGAVFSGAAMATMIHADTTADSTIYDGYSWTSNYGSESNLYPYIYHSGFVDGEGHALIRFADLPVGVMSCTSAILHLTTTGTTSACSGNAYLNENGLITVYGITGEWGESTVTWANSPSVDAAATGVLSVAEKTISYYDTDNNLVEYGVTEMTCDVTALANRWLGNPTSNWGVYLSPQQNLIGAQFFSREAFGNNGVGANDIPWLEIQIVPEPATLTMLMLGGFLIRRK